MSRSNEQLGIQKVRRPRRVVMLLENDSYPDDTRILLESHTLRDAGYQVLVICPSGTSRRFHENLDGVHVYRFLKTFEPGGLLGYAWEYGYSLAITFVILLYVAGRYGFDVLHARTPPDFYVLIGGFFKLFGTRYVVDMNDLPPELYQAQRDGAGNRMLYSALCWFERLNCRTADYLIATSEAQRRIQIERGGAQHDRCLVVRNVPSERFFETVEPLPSIRDGKRVVVGYMGIIGKQDRVDMMLRALSIVKHELHRSDFLAVIVGTGSALNDLKQLSRELDLDDCVRFAGYRVGDDLLRHVASFDICVTPDPSNPYNDTCAMLKMMEYMAMAKPIVAFDLPENRLTAGDAAIFVQNNDVAEFARQIARLLDDPSLREQLGQVGRRRAMEFLSWGDQQQHLLQAYRRLFAPGDAVASGIEMTPAAERSGLNATTATGIANPHADAC